jgi:hypothetical protein
MKKIMKISETKLRKIVKKRLQVKQLDEQIARLLKESQPTMGSPEVDEEPQADLGAATKKSYNPKYNNAKMPSSKTEAGTYMMKATRSAAGITSVEIPALIQIFDDMLAQFIATNMTASKASKVGKGIEIGKSRAGIKDVLDEKVVIR